MAKEIEDKMKGMNKKEVFDFTGRCMHCKRKLETKEEIEHEWCNACWEQYSDEMDAMYGDEW